MIPKAQTYQQKLGFFDEDLKKPKHDEIMYWFDKNLENILRTKIFRNIQYDEDYSPMRNVEIILEKIWERPVLPNNSKFIIGFIDLLISARLSFEYEEIIEYDILEDNRTTYDKKYVSEWESVRKGDLKYKEPYKIWKKGNTMNLNWCFEIKTEIKSIGELIRQINTYREYISAPFFIVCSDVTHVNLLKAQGIGFIEYPSGKIL